MITDRSHSDPSSRARLCTPGCLAVLAAATLLGGCASGSVSGGDAALAMFVDPARYDLYNCAQLRTARRAQEKRISDVEALMAKARTGTGGSVVAEVAYRGDYNNARANYNLADQVWQRNKCDSEKLPPEKLSPAAPTVSTRDPLLPPENEQLRQVDQMYQTQPNR